MDRNVKENNLYIKKIYLSKEIPNNNYLKELPVIANLKN